MRSQAQVESAVDWKARAIEQWTETPCGPVADGAAQLIEGRREYAPWMPAALDYAGARGLEVLDVGCGQGIDLCEYARAGAHATGVDLTPRHLELARLHLAELGLDATVVEGDAERLPFPDASFDRCSSNGVLHHTPDLDAALREILRVLRPGGLATIIVYNRNSWHFWLQQVVGHGLVRGQLLRKPSVSAMLSENVERGNGRPLVRVYTRRQMANALRRAGFESVTTESSPVQAGETSLRTSRLPGNGWYVIARGVKPGA